MKRMRHMRVLISLMLTVVMLFGTVPTSLMHVHAQMQAEEMAVEDPAANLTEEEAAEEAGTEVPEEEAAEASAAVTEETEAEEEAETEAEAETETEAEAETETEAEAAEETVAEEDAATDEEADAETVDSEEDPAQETVREAEGRTPLLRGTQVLCADRETLVKEIRAQMKRQTTDITVFISEELAETFLGSDEDLMQPLLAEVYKDDGTPTGGSYLELNVNAYSYFDVQEAGEDYVFTFWAEYRSDADMEAQMDEAVENLIDELGIRNASDLVKVTAIHEYIYKHVWYDYDHLGDESYTLQFTPYAAMFYHTAVCQGYALLFYRLTREVGLSSECISSDSMNHMWNTVKLGDLYYQVDVTWDAESWDDTYFLKGSMDFFGHSNSDDEYSNADYASAYPLSQFGYSHSGSGMVDVLGYAPDLTMRKIGGGEVSARAENGKAKVIVFTLEGCEFVRPMIQNMGAVDFSRVDVVLCASDTILDWAKIAPVREYMESLLPGVPEVSLCMQTEPELFFPEYNVLRALELQSSIIAGFFYSPTIFVINPQNQIIYAHQGAVDDLKEVIDAYTGSNSPSTMHGSEHSGWHSWNVIEYMTYPSQSKEGYGYFECSVCKKIKYDMIPRMDGTIHGQCGEEAFWTFDTQSKELTVSGSGATWDNHVNPNMIGWVESDGWIHDVISETWIYADEVKTVTIEEGITSLGGMIFRWFDNVEVIHLPSTLETVGIEGYAPFPAEEGGCHHTIIFTSKEKPTLPTAALASALGLTTYYYPASWGAFTEEELARIYWDESIELIPYDTLDDGWVSKADGWHYYKNFESLKGWQKISGSWYYMNTAGVMQTNWQSIDGSWYYFGSDGAMKTGWQSIGGKWYFFNESGIMASGWKQIGGKWYYLNNTMSTGWKQIDGGWYYFGNDGAMKTGWQSIGGKWYYLNSTMVTGWRLIDGTWYYFGTDGAMKTDWVKIGQVWYYFGTSGAMAKNWKQVGGTWYYFGNDGAMKTDWKKVDGGWYYFGSDGAMRSGWAKIDGVWYYFDPAAGNMMASSKTLTISGKQYTFASNGAWVE